jgi:hypothetical protein
VNPPVLALLPLQPVIDHLALACGKTFKRYGAAADMAAATAANLVAGGPAATVILVGGEPRQIQEGSGPFRQVVDVTIAVVVGVNLAGATGAQGVTRLETPLNAARAALFGWLQPDARDRFCHAGDSL